MANTIFDRVKWIAEKAKYLVNEENIRRSFNEGDANELIQAMHDTVEC